MTLLEAGVEPLILEASDRPGGRVRTLEDWAGFPIELGAEEVHGTGNAAFDLIAGAGAEIIRHQTTNDRLRLDGRLLPLDVAAADQDVRRAMDFLQSVGDYAGENCTAQELLIRRHFPRRSWHYLDSRLGVEHGTTLDRLAMGGFAGYERGWEHRENNFTLRGPYLDLFRRWIGQLGDRLQTRSPVASIDWRERPVTRLRDGRALSAETVVVTASVAVLRDGVIGFDPVLPTEKIAAFDAVGMDAGMKILLQFREPFWEEQMYFLHTDGFLLQFWVTGKGKSAEPVLTAFVGGSRAETLARLGVDPVRFALGELDQVFGQAVASGAFVRGCVADWGADPWVRGLYSYPTTATTAEVRAELGRPLAGKLFFAGEATDRKGHSGTVHGAIDSGRRAAAEILGA